MRPELPLDPAADVEDGDQDEVATREVTSEEDRATGARVANSPQWHGAAVATACSAPLIDPAGEQYSPRLDELAGDLRAKFAKIQSGDLGDPEAMLLAQAHALQALFSHLAVRALGERSLSMMQMCMSVALKAQAQSRVTLTALGDMKRPRHPNFIEQQNVAVNQQVNNSASPMVAGETKNPQSKLLGAQHGNGWTPERKTQQAMLIRRWKPWEKSTGPKTAEGKAKVSQNTYKGGTRNSLRDLASLLRRPRAADLK